MGLETNSIYLLTALNTDEKPHFARPQFLSSFRVSQLPTRQRSTHPRSIFSRICVHFSLLRALPHFEQKRANAVGSFSWSPSREEGFLFLFWPSALRAVLPKLICRKQKE